MKSILINLDDEDFKLLEEVKGDRSWRDVLLTLVRDKKEVRE